MNRAIEGARGKGETARLRGWSRGACPYKDIRNRDRRNGRLNHVTFSRAFIQAWRNGWDKADKYMKRVGDTGKLDYGN
jgi:ribosome modulation factor